MAPYGLVAMPPIICVCPVERLLLHPSGKYRGKECNARNGLLKTSRLPGSSPPSPWYFQAA
jgi:hypothetical protein